MARDKDGDLIIPIQILLQSMGHYLGRSVDGDAGPRTNTEKELQALFSNEDLLFTKDHLVSTDDKALKKVIETIGTIENAMDEGEAAVTQYYTQALELVQAAHQNHMKYQILTGMQLLDKDGEHKHSVHPKNMAAIRIFESQSTNDLENTLKDIGEKVKADDGIRAEMTTLAKRVVAQDKIGWGSDKNDAVSIEEDKIRYQAYLNIEGFPTQIDGGIGGQSILHSMAFLLREDLVQDYGADMRNLNPELLIAMANNPTTETHVRMLLDAVKAHDDNNDPQDHDLGLALSANQIYKESSFNPGVPGDDGNSLGLTQFNKNKVGKYGLDTIDDFFNPQKSVDAYVLYKSELLTNHEGDQILALAEYNAGGALITSVRNELNEDHNGLALTGDNLLMVLQNRANERPLRDYNLGKNPDEWPPIDGESQQNAWDQVTLPYIKIILGLQNTAAVNTPGPAKQEPVTPQSLRDSGPETDPLDQRLNQDLEEFTKHSYLDPISSEPKNTEGEMPKLSEEATQPSATVTATPGTVGDLRAQSFQPLETARQFFKSFWNSLKPEQTNTVANTAGTVGDLRAQNAETFAPIEKLAKTAWNTLNSGPEQTNTAGTVGDLRAQNAETFAKVQDTIVSAIGLGDPVLAEPNVDLRTDDGPGVVAHAADLKAKESELEEPTPPKTLGKTFDPCAKGDGASFSPIELDIPFTTLFHGLNQERTVNLPTDEPATAKQGVQGVIVNPTDSSVSGDDTREIGDFNVKTHSDGTMTIVILDGETYDTDHPDFENQINEFLELLTPEQGLALIAGESALTNSYPEDGKNPYTSEQQLHLLILPELESREVDWATNKNRDANLGFSNTPDAATLAAIEASKARVPTPKEGVDTNATGSGEQVIDIIPEGPPKAHLHDGKVGGGITGDGLNEGGSAIDISPELPPKAHLHDSKGNEDLKTGQQDVQPKGGVGQGTPQPSTQEPTNRDYTLYYDPYGTEAGLIESFTSDYPIFKLEKFQLPGESKQDAAKNLYKHEDLRTEMKGKINATEIAYGEQGTHPFDDLHEGQEKRFAEAVKEAIKNQDPVTAALYMAAIEETAKLTLQERIGRVTANEKHDFVRELDPNFKVETHPDLMTAIEHRYFTQKEIDSLKTMIGYESSVAPDPASLTATAARAIAYTGSTALDAMEAKKLKLGATFDDKAKPETVKKSLVETPTNEKQDPVVPPQSRPDLV